MNSAPMDSLCPQNPGSVGASSCPQNIERNGPSHPGRLAASQAAQKTFSFRVVTARPSDPHNTKMKSERVPATPYPGKLRPFVTSDQNVFQIQCVGWVGSGREVEE